jgi:hypothetical protein
MIVSTGGKIMGSLRDREVVLLSLGEILGRRGFRLGLLHAGQSGQGHGGNRGPSQENEEEL